MARTPDGGDRDELWLTYDYLGTSASGRERTLSEWWTDEERRETLLTKGTELGAQGKAGRLDAITVPVGFLAARSGASNARA